MGACAGFDFRKVGLPGIPVGSWPRAALIAACTSRAAESRFRPSANSSMIDALPCRLSE